MMLHRKSRKIPTTRDGRTPTSSKSSLKSKRNNSALKTLLLLFVACSLLLISTNSSSHEKGTESLAIPSSMNPVDKVSAKVPAKVPVKVTVEDDKSDWPSVAVEGVGNPLVKKGTNFVSDMHNILYKSDHGETLMDEFVEVYKNRPDQTNICGVRFNHALALFVAVRHLQPRLVIESGVNAGQSTYFMRKAKEDMEIIALDPEEKPICNTKKRWIDPSEHTKYYLGKDFKDITDFNWIEMAKDGTITPERTLVFLDDHLSFYQRLPSIMKAGIKHLIVEDNYKRGEGATKEDKMGHTPKQLFGYLTKDGRVSPDAQWLFNNLVSYAEFPPLVPPIMSKKYIGVRKKAGGFMFSTDTNTDIVAPLLRSDVNQEHLELYEKIASSLGYDPENKDHESYMQFMNYNQICYLELLPISPHIVKNW